MNFIQKYNRIRKLNRFVLRKRNNGKQVCSWEQAQSICLLYTFETPQLLEELMKLISVLKKKKNNITLYCYVPKEDNVLIDKQIDVHFLLEKDFDFKGTLQKEKRLSLRRQSFDMLINLDREPSLCSLYLSSEIKAKFRIGRNENYKNYNDIILYSSDERYSFEDYFQFVEKYTEKIISE